MGAAATSLSTTERREPVVETVERLLKGGSHSAVVAIVRQLLARNEELERRRAGTEKNEAIGRDQLLLLVNKAEETRPAEEPGPLAEADQKLRSASGIDDGGTKKGKTPRTPHARRGLPENLRRVPHPITVPADERACPVCGKERGCIGHETTETLELVPAELVVRQDIREKLACKPCEANLVRAPVGDKVVAGGIIGPSVVAQILVDKYRDGLPLTRQLERWSQLGWNVATSTLCDQVAHAAELLEPVYRAAGKLALAAEVLHFDGTQLRVRNPQRPEVIYGGTLWGCLGKTGDVSTAYFVFATTAKKEGQLEGELGPQEILRGRIGPTVADASNTFDSAFRQPGICECGCHMHGRRCFCRALDGGDVRAAVVIAAYKKLYEIEREVRGQDPAEVLRQRKARSESIVNELLAWCRTYQVYEPPQTPLGKAVRYLVNHEVALRRFLEDGRVPMDNGAIERQFIRVALARMNFLFAGSEAGARRAAVIFTVLACCELAGVEPLAYLRDVLPRLARTNVEASSAEYLPHRWKARQAPKP
jgi:transposase